MSSLLLLCSFSWFMVLSSSQTLETLFIYSFMCNLYCVQLILTLYPLPILFSMPGMPFTSFFTYFTATHFFKFETRKFFLQKVMRDPPRLRSLINGFMVSTSVVTQYTEMCLHLSLYHRLHQAKTGSY